MSNDHQTAPAALRELADELLDAQLDASPLIFSLVGLRERDDRLTDYTEAGGAATRARAGGILDRVEALDPAALTAQDRVTWAVVRQQAADARDEVDLRAVEYTVTDAFGGAAADLLRLLPMVGIGEPAHAEGYLARLAALPAALAAVAQRHRAGIAAGRLPVRRSAQAAVDQLERFLADPAGDPLRGPEPAAGGDVDLAGFRAARDRLLDEVVHPAFAGYRDALAADVVPHGRPDEQPGLCWLPDGEQHYATLVRLHTTTDLTPQQLHETGLAVIAKLADEYAEIGSRVFGTGQVDQVFGRLRDDPALRWSDGDELLAAARAAVERAEQAAPAWFGRLPSQRCRVAPVPDADAPGAPPAYYLQPALDGTRPGTYFANTYRAAERYRYNAEATAFHEAVPGHHFQRTIAQELTDLPLLRRLARVTAYTEGWGLYCERLADEMGLYSGDLARLGMLCLDSMRAGRLVVDTGLHAHGWSRQRAVDYLRSHTPMSTVEIESEVDRYIATPGQALAYLVGRLEIERLRADATRVLDGRFDLRGFHDLVLGSGPLPLRVLAQVVQAWVDDHRG
ncbi:MAG: DUF885 family protein [Micromonosporaceae bacterium]|nr:DUF885 family protein [Micromonosporaceae bacterium]